MKKVVKFPKHKARKPSPGDPIAQGDTVEELCLPEPQRMNPQQLMTALSRDPAPRMEHAVVIMTKTIVCPCGCGDLTEDVVVCGAGPQMSTERMLWISKKLEMYALGVEVGPEYDDV